MSEKDTLGAQRFVKELAGAPKDILHPTPEDVVPLDDKVREEVRMASRDIAAESFRLLPNGQLNRITLAGESPDTAGVDSVMSTRLGHDGAKQIKIELYNVQSGDASGKASYAYIYDEEKPNQVTVYEQGDLEGTASLQPRPQNPGEQLAYNDYQGMQLPESEFVVAFELMSLHNAAIHSAQEAARPAAA